MSDKDKNAEPIVSRVIRLNQLILGKVKNNHFDYHAISRDGLLDALFALYSECNTPHLKKDPNVLVFVEKFQSLMAKLQSLRVNISDFEVKKIIGRGNFGEVQVVREKSTGDVYAMKVLHKAETLAHQSVAFYEEERDIMAKATSPWITKLQYAFQDAQNLYLIMEFHAGGDMLSLLERCNVLSEDMARFYLAELVLAIHSVHMMGYVHRDIKPDNILIDITGHIKLADFGSSSKLNSLNLITSEMPVGTPDYIAPEVLVSMNNDSAKSAGYGVECDWWSLGIVAYEMLYGVTPFANEKLLVVYNNIMNFKESLKFPDESEENSESILDLIKNLLTNANERLNYDQLIIHPLFADIDWNNIREIVPPFVPVVSGQDDTSNFDEFEHEVRPLISDLGLGLKSEFSGRNLPFIGFSYIASMGINTERLSSADNSFNSPIRQSLSDSDTSFKKLSEMQKTISDFICSEENLKSDNKKLYAALAKRDKKIDKYENEISRLENEISSLQANKKELKRLLQLEREDRILTEKKASQILKCMKKKRKRNLANCPEDEPLGKMSEQLDNAFIEFNHNLDEETGPFMRLMERARSLSPRYVKNEIGICSETYSVLEKENRLLKEEIRKAEVEKEKVMLAAKLYHDGQTDLDQELTLVSRERDEALAKIEELKKQIIKLELQVYDFQNEGKINNSGTYKVTSMIDNMQKDVDIKNNTIFELKTQLLHMREKKSELEKQIKSQEDEIQDLTCTKQELEEKLKYEIEKSLSQSVQIADLKQTITTVRKDFMQVKNELYEFKEKEPQENILSLERVRQDNIKCRDILRLNLRIAELEKQLETYKENETQESVSSKETPIKQFADSSTSNSSFNTASETTASFEDIPSKEQSFKSIYSDQRSFETLSNENEQLKEKITELEEKINTLINLAKNEENSHTNLTNQLKEKETELQDVKLDLRILTREKKDADDLLGILRGNNRTLKEKVSELEKKLFEKEKLETELKDKVDILQKEVLWKERDIDEKVKMYETQKDMNKAFVKTQDQIQQIAQEKEKFKTDSTIKETEKMQMSAKLETLEKQLDAKKKECLELDNIVTTLKAACTDMDGQLTDFEELVKKRESELKIMAQENSRLKQRIMTVESELKLTSVELAKEKKMRQDLEEQIKELEEDLENQQLLHETVVASLQESTEHQKSVITNLEHQITEMEQQLSSYDNDVSIRGRKAASLEEELIQVKEEAAKYITHISSLKASNLSLTQELEQMIENQKEAEGVIDRLTTDLESAEATFNHERVKYQEQLCQQSKLIDFLRAKTENSDRRKKVRCGFHCFTS